MDGAAPPGVTAAPSTLSCTWSGLLVRCAGRLLRRGPAGEEGERLVRRRTRLGGERDERLAGVGSEFESLVGEGEVADDAVPEALGAGGLPADVVRRPQGGEALAAGRELSDELFEGAVVRVTPRLGARQGDTVRGGAVPFRVELASPRIQETCSGRGSAAARCRCGGRRPGTCPSTARASGLAPRMSRRPFWTNAGTPVTASSSC